MNRRFLSAGLLGLATLLTSYECSAAGPGVILISTRKAQDQTFATADVIDQKGPGQISQGDAAMQIMLGDYGYSCRMAMDVDIAGAGTTDYFAPVDSNFLPILIIASGSSGSADVQDTLSRNVPVLMGEHSCLGARTLAGNSSIYMYTHTDGSSTGNDTTGGLYMKVTDDGKNHPILAGIPRDAQDRIKIFRDPYPEENANVPPTGKPNYFYSWAWATPSKAAEGTKILGLLDSNQARCVFAVNDIGGKLGNGNINAVRLVHWIVNEDGSGGSRRAFNCLTDAGRLIFIRTVKWALGESLTPAPSILIKEVTAVGAGRMNIKWDGTATKNYKILATTDVTGANWQTVIEDIHGLDGTNTKNLDFAAGPQVAFLKIRAVP